MIASKNASSRKGFWLRLAGTLLTLALLVYLLREQGWAEIQLALRQITVWQLLLSLAVVMISRMAVCARWHVLLRGASLDVRFSQTARITFAGFFASNFLPTTIGGDVVRLAGAVQLRFDSAVATASLVVDRLVGMAGMAMALPLGIPAFRAALGPSSWNNSTPPLALAAALALSGRFEMFWNKWRSWIKGFFLRILRALTEWVSRPRALFEALGFTWVHMLCLYVSMQVLLVGMGEPMPFWLIAGLWSVVYFITLLPVSINGYGLQEVSLAFIFTRVGGITAPTALTLAILVRTITLVASLPGAFFVPGIMAARSETTEKGKNSNEDVRIAQNSSPQEADPERKSSRAD